MDFQYALTALKDGRKVQRSGWNGKGMWIKLVRFNDWNAVDGLNSYRLLPWIGMKTADEGFVPWLASQTDLLADDWSIVE